MKRAIRLFLGSFRLSGNKTMIGPRDEEEDIEEFDDDEEEWDDSLDDEDEEWEEDIEEDDE